MTADSNTKFPLFDSLPPQADRIGASNIRISTFRSLKLRRTTAFVLEDKCPRNNLANLQPYHRGPQ